MYSEKRHIKNELRRSLHDLGYFLGRRLNAKKMTPLDEKRKVINFAVKITAKTSAPFNVTDPLLAKAIVSIMR